MAELKPVALEGMRKLAIGGIEVGYSPESAIKGVATR